MKQWRVWKQVIHMGAMGVTSRQPRRKESVEWLLDIKVDLLKYQDSPLVHTIPVLFEDHLNELEDGND